MKRKRHQKHTSQRQVRMPYIISAGLAAVAVVAGASLVVPQASESFTDANQTPPQGNVEAPINISNDDQWKEGSLGVGTSSAPGATLDVGSSANIQGATRMGGPLYVDSGNVISADDMIVRNATPVNESKRLTDLLGQSGGGGGGPGTPSAVLNQGNTSGGTQIDMENEKIVNVATPNNPSDAATKAYVDAQTGGGAGGGGYKVSYAQKGGGILNNPVPQVHCAPGYDFSNSSYATEGNPNPLIECVPRSNSLIPVPNTDLKMDTMVVLHQSFKLSQKQCRDRGTRLPTQAEINQLGRGGRSSPLNKLTHNAIETGYGDVVGGRDEEYFRAIRFITSNDEDQGYGRVGEDRAREYLLLCVKDN